MEPESQSPAASSVSPAPSAPGPSIRAGWLRGVLLFVTYFIWSVIYGIPIMLIFSVYTEEAFFGLMKTPLGLPIYVYILGGTILLVWVFRRWIDRRSLISLGFSFASRFRKDMLWGMLWGIGMVAAVFLVLWSTNSIIITNWGFPWQSLLIMLGVLFMAALMEEIVLRGYMLKNFMQSMNPLLALVFSSVLFSLCHALNPNVSLMGLFNIILAGLVLGVYYIHRQNLWFPTGLHLTWNYFQGTVFGSPVSGIEIDSVLTIEITGNELITGGEFGFEASLVASAVIVIATVLIHFIYRRPREIGADPNSS